MTDIMAFGAHPDDVEFCCGGILCKAASQNKTMVIVDLTLGEKGTNGTPEIRKEEGFNAAKRVGAQRLYLDFIDCEVFDTYENRLKLVEVIRQHQPRLLLAPNWKGPSNHPDHIACGTMVRHAARYARFKNILPNLPPHRVEGVLHYLYPGQQNPDFLVDISDHLDEWQAMMNDHASQMKTGNYTEWNTRFAATLGVVAGCDYAQGLIQGDPRVVDDVMSLSQGSFSI